MLKLEDGSDPESLKLGQSRSLPWNLELCFISLVGCLGSSLCADRMGPYLIDERYESRFWKQRGWFKRDWVKSSEESHFVNVYSPPDVKADEVLPVLVSFLFRSSPSQRTRRN